MNQRIDYANRRAKILRHLSKNNKLDVFLVTSPHDISYLTGFSCTEKGSAYLLLAARWCVVLPGAFYRQQMADECPDIVCSKYHATWAGVSSELKGKSVRRIGVQAENMTLVELSELRSLVGKRNILEVVYATGLARMIKGDCEVSCIRKAVSIAKQAFEELVSVGAQGLIGRTEKDIALELEYQMRRRGATCQSFDTIVAAGPNSSRCHHIPTARKIRHGDPLLIDWGARWGGYCSDLTRTLFVGRISEQFNEIYNVVLDASRAAIKKIKPGVQCSTVDRAARRVIEVAGYGDNFIHSLGHGLGKDVHEFPYLSAKGKTRLKSGVVITVEPGIYLPGKGGVRIEDDIVVTTNGAQKLSGPATTLKRMIIT